MTPSLPSLFLGVHVRTQQAGSSPRAQMLSVNTEIPERKQGFTAASCTHSQDLQRPGARRGQPAPHKHRPPCLLSEPLVLLPGSGEAWFRAGCSSSPTHGSGRMNHRVAVTGLGPLSACHRQEVNSYWLLNKWLQCLGLRGLFPPHSPSLDKHVLTEQLHTNPLGEILHIVPQAADKWNSYSTCKHDLLRTDTQKCICTHTQLNTTILM